MTTSSMSSSTTSSQTPDLPAASGLTGQTTELPTPGEYPSLDAQTQVPIIMGVCAAFMVLSTLVVSARLYTRYGLIKAAGEDDLVIIAAQVTGIGLATTTILQSAYGLGRHTWMVSQEDRTMQLRLLLATEIIYNTTQAVTKVSLLLQYRRIFRGSRTRLVSLLLIIFVLAWCVASILMDSFACTPMAILNPRLRGTCLQSLLVWSLSSAVNIVTNFAVVAVPVPATWALQLHRRQRIVLTVLFGLGFCTGIVAIARILTIRKAALSVDVSWDSSAISYLGVVEVNVGIICACLITLRPLLSALFAGMGLKSSYGRACGAGGCYYGPGLPAVDRAGSGPGGTGTKKSSRDTVQLGGTHADHGIYGLADLEVTKVLAASQEGLTAATSRAAAAACTFEPAYFINSSSSSGGAGRVLLPHEHLTSTSITAGGPRLSGLLAQKKKNARTVNNKPGVDDDDDDDDDDDRRGQEAFPPIERIKTRAGDIMVTRETTIREETRAVSPEHARQYHLDRQDDWG